MKSRKQNGKMTRSAFIRSQPSAMSAQDVVAAGKREGLDIKLAMVHKVRWMQKAAKAANGKSSPKPKIIRVLKKQEKSPELAEDEMSAVAYASLQLVVRTEVRREMRRIMGAVES